MLYIFDMGGVVLHGVFELQDILKEQGLDSDANALYCDSLMDDLSAGRIDEAAYWEAFNRSYGSSVAGDRWGKTFRPRLDRDMCDFIRDLRTGGQRVVCGSNTFDSHYRISVERGDYDCFDKVYASHLMGSAKPDPRFWQSILEAEGAEPGETVFVDDFALNVKAAERLGIRAYLFRDLPTLREELALPIR